VEVRLGMALMMKHLNLDYHSLGMKKLWFFSNYLGHDFDQMNELKEKSIKKEPFSKQDLIT